MVPLPFLIQLEHLKIHSSSTVKAWLVGVCCHFLLQCMEMKSESEVAQSCPTLHDPMDCSIPGPSVHGIFQARVLEWVAIAFSMLVHEMSAIVQSFEHSLVLLFSRFGMKADLFSGN